MLGNEIWPEKIRPYFIVLSGFTSESGFYCRELVVGLAQEIRTYMLLPDGLGQGTFGTGAHGSFNHHGLEIQDKVAGALR